MNVITGLPRAGTTLICNIINQNEQFHATSTSGLCELLATLSNKFSTMDEITSDLISGVRTQDDLLQTLKYFSNWYHKNNGHKLVFDKSRGWMLNNVLYKSVFPKGKMIACVRDPRYVFNSIEKQHRKTGVFDGANSAIDKTLISRAKSLFADDGMIGMSIRGVEDMIRRKSNPFIIKYEDFVKQPEFIMREVYKYLEIEYFDHDFNEVINTSNDVDELYRKKCPHNGSGKVSEIKEELLFNEEFGKQILDRFPLYCKTFGYN